MFGLGAPELIIILLIVLIIFGGSSCPEVGAFTRIRGKGVQGGSRRGREADGSGQTEKKSGDGEAR